MNSKKSAQRIWQSLAIRSQWSMIPSSCRTFAVLTLAILLGGSAAAQTNTNQVALKWWIVAGGGGSRTGTNYSLRCTIGQPFAGKASGTNYTLAAGFWAVAIQTLAAPLLQITKGPSDSVIVYWDKSAGDFALDQATQLDGTAVTWSPMALSYQTNSTSIYLTVPANGRSQFFRLRKQ